VVSRAPPPAQILCVSYAQDLADELSRDCRHIVASGWYRQIFPTCLPPLRAAMPEFDTTAQGCRLATSIGGVLTGRALSISVQIPGERAVRLPDRAL
jgi:hypothetical protein